MATPTQKTNIAILRKRARATALGLVNFHGAEHSLRVARYERDRSRRLGDSELQFWQEVAIEVEEATSSHFEPDYGS